MGLVSVTAAQQRVHVPLRQPARVPPKGRAAQPPQPQAGQQHHPSPRGRCATLVLVQVAHVGAQLLAERRPGVAARRPAPHVHRAGARVEPRLEAGIADPAEQVDLLGVQEERLVEAAAGGVQGLPPQQHRSAGQPVHPAWQVVLEAAAVEGVQHRRTRRQLAQEQVLGRQPVDARVAAAGPLQPPVLEAQPRPHRTAARARLTEPHQLVDAASIDERVAVQQEHEAPRGLGETPVVARAEAQVAVERHELHVRPLGPQPVRRAVGRRVVDHDQLAARRGSVGVRVEGLEAAPHQVAGLVGHHDHRHVHGHCGTSLRRNNGGAATITSTSA